MSAGASSFSSMESRSRRRGARTAVSRGSGAVGFGPQSPLTDEGFHDVVQMGKLRAPWSHLSMLMKEVGRFCEAEVSEDMAAAEPSRSATEDVYNRPNLTYVDGPEMQRLLMTRSSGSFAQISEMINHKRVKRLPLPSPVYGYSYLLEFLKTATTQSFSYFPSFL